jgi:hypothetical protein
VCFYAGCAFKRDIGYLFAEQISEITAIPKNVLLGSSLLHCNVAQRMSWASTRKTTREEDMAYCLMGPFDVQMPPIYGEGSEKAFLRLQEEILKRSSDQTLFLWTPSHEPYNQGLLATSPRAFCTHYDCFSWLMDVTDVRTISQNGFSPYSFFRPTSSAASTQTFNTQRPEYHFGDQDSNDGASLASLGPRGLQISLLSSIDEVAFGTKFQRQTIISLDVFAVLDGYHTKIALILVPDVAMDFTNKFIPYRLGGMRREVCMDPGSIPRLINSAPLSFKRRAITVSQIGNSEPGNPVSFKFRDLRSEYLVEKVRILDPEGPTDAIFRLPERFTCSGGSAEVRHACRRCNEQGRLVLIFGTRGRHSEPWCALASTSWDQSIEDTYRERESYEGPVSLNMRPFL